MALSGAAPRVVAHSLTGRDWIEPAVELEHARALARRFALPEVVARLLAMRGIDEVTAPVFLEPRLRTQMPDPSVLRDMDAAAERLADAVQRGERIGIISDYDVDGCTSAALVIRWARQLGVAPVLEIPHRLHDGYGPSVPLIDRLHAAGCRLVLVLDSGTTAFEPLAHAAERGLGVIVVDHHQGEPTLPPAVAVVNPNRQDEDGRWGTLAAVGVTFLLLVATNRVLRARGHVRRDGEPSLIALLDLVALGTIADVVPLVALNRAFVAQGLRVMAEAPQVGIRALADVARVTWPVGAGSVAFALAPRLNAAGRLDDPLQAAELLVTDDAARAAALAHRLDGLNAERRGVEQALADRAAAVVEAQVAAGRRVLFAHGADWHPGVLGIVAGRLAERFHRPVLVAGVRDGRAVGSGRAPDGHDLGAALRAAAAAGLTLKAGGHARAGGFTVDAGKLDAFHDALEATASLPTAPTLRVDAPVAVGGAMGELVAALARLEPYGERHPRPRLRVVGGRLADLRVVGERHLKFRVHGGDGARLQGIAFRACDGPLEAALIQARDLPAVQLAGRLERDRYRGGAHCELHLDDIAVEP